MVHALLQALQGLPAELVVIALAAMPIAELRAAIPIGVSVYGMLPLQAFAYAIVGNAIPVALVYWFFPPLFLFIKKHWPWLNRLIESKIGALERKHKASYDRYGFLFLLIFVAVPIPGSGVYMGTVLGIIFQIERRYSIPALLIGMVLAGMLMLGITTGAIKGLEFLLQNQT